MEANSIASPAEMRLPIKLGPNPPIGWELLGNGGISYKILRPFNNNTGRPLSHKTSCTENINSSAMMERMSIPVKNSLLFNLRLIISDHQAFLPATVKDKP
jgi:hypothetical protein